MFHNLFFFIEILRLYSFIEKYQGCHTAFILRLCDSPLSDTSRNEDTMHSPSEKGEPVPLSDASKYEDTMNSPTEKREPVPLSDTSRNEDTMHSPSEKGEPVPLSDASRYEDTIHTPIEKAEPVTIIEGSKNEDTAPTPKQTRSQDGSVLIYKNGQFIPNKIQILEEHEEYTVFKVFAVKL